LEYEGAVFKNLRRQEGRTIFEIKLPNDGFYKSTSDPSFGHAGASSSTRKYSLA